MMFRLQENIIPQQKRWLSSQEKAEKARCSSGDASSCVIPTVTLCMRQRHGQNKKVSFCQESWVRDEEVRHSGIFLNTYFNYVCMCVSFVDMYMCAQVPFCVQVPIEARGMGSPWTWTFSQLWATLWVVRTEFWSYWRAVSAQNLWAIFPAPHWGIFTDSIRGCNCDCISQFIVSHTQTMGHKSGHCW